MNNLIYFKRETVGIIKHDLKFILNVFFTNNPIEELEKIYGEIMAYKTSFSCSDFSLLKDNGECVGDLEAVKLVQDKMGNMPAALASEEGMWSALSLSEQFWPYVRKRWFIPALERHCNTKEPPINMEQKDKISQWLLARIFFENYRITRHVLARLWWIGKMTFVEGEDPYKLTTFVMRSEALVTAIFERSQGSNRTLVRNLCFELMKREKNGELTVNQNLIRELFKYVNACGGGILIDEVANNPDSLSFLMDAFLKWYRRR